MPLISGDNFVPDKRFRNGHYNTFIPALFYTNPKISFSRVRLMTPDDDFLDVDCSLIGSDKVVVICHGLEGDATSGYMLHFIDYYNRQGYDVICPVYRGCSGEMNRQLRMYNSGTTDDLHLTIDQLTKEYQSVDLIGFSLGGNLVLKYLGEGTFEVPHNIVSGVAISAPVHLYDASIQLLKYQNFAYQLRFVVSLWKKAIAKKKQYPDRIDLSLSKMWNLYRFDEYFTAPIYGYKDAKDYYDQNSSLQFLPDLCRPALLINALDDPFLGPLCYPYEVAKNSDNFYFCAPKYGGHVGFAKDAKDRSWIKDTSYNFIKSKEVS